MSIQRSLAVLLVLQLLLAAYMWRPTTSGPAAQQVLPWDVERIRSVRIESTSTRARRRDIELRRTPDGWVLASGFDFPVVGQRVDDLLRQLASLHYRAPISENPERHEQLNVDDGTPTRRLTFDVEGEEHVLLIGAASGKRMNLRLPGTDAVYQIEGLGAWALADSEASWFASERLKLPEEALKEISLTTPTTAFTLERDDDGWTVVGLAPGRQPDRNRIQTFVNYTRSVLMTAPVDPSFASAEPRFTYAWTLQDGTTGQYYGLGTTPEDDLIVQLPGLPPFEAASALAREQLEGTRLEDLLVPLEVP